MLRKRGIRPTSRRWSGAAAALLFTILAFCVQPAFALDQADQREALRLQATEFCATVGKPPEVLAKMLNTVGPQDPKMWGPVIEWWNRIAEKYEKAGCGDV